MGDTHLYLGPSVGYVRWLIKQGIYDELRQYAPAWVIERRRAQLDPAIDEELRLIPKMAYDTVRKPLARLFCELMTMDGYPMSKKEEEDLAQRLLKYTHKENGALDDRETVRDLARDFRRSKIGPEELPSEVARDHGWKVINNGDSYERRGWRVSRYSMKRAVDWAKGGGRIPDKSAP
jgi:hypothetical protein